MARNGVAHQDDGEAPQRHGHARPQAAARDPEAVLHAQRTGREIRVTVPGHTQRGGAPDAADRIFATQCGVEAALGMLEGSYGFMVAQVGGRMRRVPLSEVAGRLKYVDPQCDLVREAKMLGISFGDE